MNERIGRLRNESVNAPATLSIERALIETSFYKQNEGKYSIPMMRAMNFMEICNKKYIYMPYLLLHLNMEYLYAGN